MTVEMAADAHFGEANVTDAICREYRLTEQFVVALNDVTLLLAV